MDIDLNDKRALVCGSSQGIGRAVATELAALGASITLVARDAAVLDKVKQTLSERQGQRHEVLVADFNQPETLRARIADYQARTEAIHILINNSGGPTPRPALDASSEAYLAAFSQHLVCSQILVQALVPGMKAAGYGRIINIISTSVKQPIPGLGVSNTIRGAVANWAKTLAGELGPFGITVNNVLPGSTRTDRLKAIMEGKARREDTTYAEIETKELARIPLGRFAEPEEIAYAVAFLASPAAAYVSGINLPVDGGRTQCL